MTNDELRSLRESVRNSVAQHFDKNRAKYRQLGVTLPSDLGIDQVMKQLDSKPTDKVAFVQKTTEAIIARMDAGETLEG